MDKHNPEMHFGPEQPMLVIPPETVGLIRVNFLPENVTSESFVEFRRSRDKTMASEQPDLQIFLLELAKQSKHQEAFWLGVTVGYFAISEQDKKTRLTPEDLLKPSANMNLEENLEKNSHDFYKLLKEMQAKIAEESPEESSDFFDGALASLRPFSTKSPFKDLSEVLREDPRRKVA